MPSEEHNAPENSTETQTMPPNTSPAAATMMRPNHRLLLPSEKRLTGELLIADG
jgi:hypothetical protein